jgi:peptidoglycan/LPS O-acetylase OafA/YrhL
MGPRQAQDAVEAPTQTWGQESLGRTAIASDLAGTRSIRKRLIRQALSWMTVADRVGGRDNNFNAMRFVAASLVVFSHSYALSGHIAEEPLARAVGILDFGGVAVIIFFVISGFLVTRSAQLTPNLGYFVRARLLRIWPGLMLTAMLSVFVLGPVATELPLRDFFLASETWTYLVSIPIFDVGHNLPGVFTRNPVPHGVNGSLWTIQVEVWLYAVTAALVLVRILKTPIAANLLCTGCVIGYLLFPNAVIPWIPRHDAYMTPRLVGSFLVGSMLYTNRRMVPLGTVSGVVLIVLAIMSIGTSLLGILFYVTIGYWVILLALHPQFYLPFLNSHADYSYGIYVFAFPVQQTIISIAGPRSPLFLFAMSYPIVLALAAMSWTWVESRALKLKGTHS